MPIEKRFHLGFTVGLQLFNMLTWHLGHLPPPTPFRNPANRDPTGVAPPYAGLWNRSSLLTIILRVRLSGFYSY